jgi:hypothetical protein
MELRDSLVIIFMLALFCLLYCATNKSNRDGFSLSKKPFEEDNTLFLRNPFDDIDYVTPVFEKI